MDFTSLIPLINKKLARVTTASIPMEPRRLSVNNNDWISAILTR